MFLTNEQRYALCEKARKRQELRDNKYLNITDHEIETLFDIQLDKEWHA